MQNTLCLPCGHTRHMRKHRERTEHIAVQSMSVVIARTCVLLYYIQYVHYILFRLQMCRYSAHNLRAHTANSIYNKSIQVYCEFVMHSMMQNSITVLLMRPSAVAPVDVNSKFTQKVHLATITLLSAVYYYSSYECMTR